MPQEAVAIPAPNLTSIETEIVRSVDAASPPVQFAGQSLAFSVQSNGGVVYVHTHLPREQSTELEREFNELAQEWRKETKHLSLASDKASSFALHQIIGMGEQVLPLILRELQFKTTDWFWALRAIARNRAPVIPVADQGMVRRIADIWIQWGKDNGYLGS
jgi:hypothetical protein